MTSMRALVKQRLGSMGAVRTALGPIWDRYRFGKAGRYVSLSRRIPGWTGGDEGVALLQAARELPPGASIVEVGVFLGRSVVLLAGGLDVGGGGLLYAIDPFDGSGDEFSAPLFRQILQHRRSARERYDANLRKAKVSHRVITLEGTAETVGPTWSRPIDLLFLDGDQSPEGARRAFDLFAPHVVWGGIVALHNSDPGHVAGHDGHHLVAKQCLIPPTWVQPQLIETTTLARRA